MCLLQRPFEIPCTQRNWFQKKQQHWQSGKFNHLSTTAVLNTENTGQALDFSPVLKQTRYFPLKTKGKKKVISRLKSLADIVPKYFSFWKSTFPSQSSVYLQKWWVKMYTHTICVCTAHLIKYTNKNQQHKIMDRQAVPKYFYMMPLTNSTLDSCCFYRLDYKEGVCKYTLRYSISEH